MWIEGRAGDVNTETFLSHPEDALGEFLVGGKMKMREFGDGVPHDAVDVAAKFSGLDMPDRNAHMAPGNRGHELLTPVSGQ